MDTKLTRRTALKRFAATGAGLTLGPGLLAACGSSSSRLIKVGVLTDLTGPYAIVGKSNQAVAQFAIDEINAAGGVTGRKLQAVVVDSASDPATAATVASQLVTQDNVDMVIGGVTSATREAIKGIIATRGKTLYLWPASYEGGECDENVWSCGAVPNQQIDPVVASVLSKGRSTCVVMTTFTRRSNSSASSRRSQPAVERSSESSSCRWTSPIPPPSSAR